MSEEANNKKNKTGRLSTIHMAAVERALYFNKSQSAEDLCRLLAECDPYAQHGKTKKSNRTLLSVIRQLRDTYQAEYGIEDKDSIRVSRSGGIPKYILGEKARRHLLFPHEIFYSKTDRDKLNLLLKVGEYFSLPMESFLRKENILKEGAEELLGGRIELRLQPYQSKVFADVFSAVENQQVITFKYEAQTKAKNSTNDSDLVVTPYYLKSYGNKWYLIGHVKKSQNRWTVFALDRMSCVKECKDIAPYFIDTKVIENFYENVIGFFVPPNPDGSFPKSEKELDIKSIILTMKDEKAAFFLDKNRIHKSQERSKSNPLQFHLECLDNIHLYQALLRIIDSIQWIEPSVVRNRLLSKLEEAQKTLKPQ